MIDTRKEREASGAGGGEPAKPRRHELKCWPAAFKEVASGAKRFEWRKDDRDFAVGDTLRLREWSDVAAMYTGHYIVVRVTSILRAPAFGIPEGYCIMSIDKPDTTADQRDHLAGKAVGNPPVTLCDYCAEQCYDYHEREGRRACIDCAAREVEAAARAQVATPTARLDDVERERGQLCEALNIKAESPWPVVCTAVKCELVNYHAVFAAHATLTAERDTAREQRDHECMRLVACSAAACGNGDDLTREHPYWSASYGDILQMRDTLTARAEAAERERDDWKTRAAHWKALALGSSREALTAQHELEPLRDALELARLERDEARDAHAALWDRAPDARVAELARELVAALDKVGFDTSGAMGPIVRARAAEFKLRDALAALDAERGEGTGT